MVFIAILFNAIWRYAASRGGHLLALINSVLSLAGFAAFAAYWALPISGPTAER